MRRESLGTSMVALITSTRRYNMKACCLAFSLLVPNIAGLRYSEKRRSDVIGFVFFFCQALRVLLFGTPYTSFNSDWRKQHINFFSNMSYALSFYKVIFNLLARVLYGQVTLIMRVTVFDYLFANLIIYVMVC